MKDYKKNNMSTGSDEMCCWNESINKKNSSLSSIKQYMKPVARCRFRRCERQEINNESERAVRRVNNISANME
jgi:hypothetical protein